MVPAWSIRIYHILARCIEMIPNPVKLFSEQSLNVYSRKSFIIGSLISCGNSDHFGGNGRSLLTFLFGVLQPGRGHLTC